MGILRWLHSRWWGLLLSNFFLFGIIFGIIWSSIEPLDVPGKFESIPWFIKTRWFLHILTTALVAPYATLIIHSLLRKKFWEEETKPDIQKFYQEMEVILNHFSTLHAKTLNTDDIQMIVRKTVAALSRSHFGTNQPPEPTNIPLVEIDKPYNCRICKGSGKQVEIEATGQCLRCKLYLTAWVPR